jgi:hypothetical protein
MSLIMKKLDEYKDYPKWIDSLTKEQQYEWYVRIKKSLPLWADMLDITELEQAIKDYEIRNKIL